jgi:CheY-like chemotaxis protein
VADLQAGRVEVVVRANPDTERVEVEISDNGIGIPEDVRDRLFTPGISTKRHSLGIGLWYSRTFMQATGGDVVLSESVPGERTTFVVEVPYAHDERADVTGRPAPTKQTADVLIVDDIPGWRDMLRDVVAAERCSIRTADGYADALEALGSIDFKLVILDIRLTEADEQNRDGLRLLQYLDELKLDTWAIVATVHPEDLDREMAERSPRLLAFMDKRTLETPRLRQLVRRALREPVRDRVHG